MRKYVVYKYNYKNLDVKYFIVTRFDRENVSVNVARITIGTRDKTIKCLELKLTEEDELNKECQEHIIKYINDYCDYNILKESKQ